MQGNLLCCETCPAVMHAQCAGLDQAPTGDWHCPSCTCVACGYAATTPAEEQSLPQVRCRAKQTACRPISMWQDCAACNALALLKLYLNMQQLSLHIWMPAILHEAAASTESQVARPLAYERSSRYSVPIKWYTCRPSWWSQGRVQMLPSGEGP